MQYPMDCFSREYAGSPESQPDGLKPAVQAQAKVWKYTLWNIST